MKKTVLLLLMLLVAGAVPFAHAQLRSKLDVSPTPVAEGILRLGEKLMTKDGAEIPAGDYRVAAMLDNRGESEFRLQPMKEAPEEELQGLKKNALNKGIPDPYKNAHFVEAHVTKNTLVKGMASNLDGNFTLDNISPTEAILTFSGKQLELRAVLGRDLNAKTVDLTPIFLGLQDSAPCGDNCVEGHVKVVIRNDGTSAAQGKWNVTIVDPRFFVGVLTDIPAGAEKEVVSAGKLKLTCCGSVTLDAEVHADFYNKTGVDSMESNNAKRFSLKVQ